MPKYTLINVPELSAAQDEFVDIQNNIDATWIKLSGVPRNWLERHIPRPRLSRYRGALEAIIATHNHSVPIIISHMPAMSAAIGVLDMLASKNKKHIAFSFNFTNLPQASKGNYYRRFLHRIDKFIVYSDYEKHLYADYFKIPLEKFVNVLWTQKAPPVNTRLNPIFQDPYLCAIGGEGRDFKTLLDAAEKSQIPLVIVARPHSLGNLKIPRNVKILCNIPLDETWGIAKHSMGVVVPLKDPETCCGQITVVSTCLLGIPLLTNTAHALKEYIVEESATLTFDFGNSDDLAMKMNELMSRSSWLNSRAVQLKGFYAERHSRVLWSSAIEQCLDGFN